jgi:hypothetical protein
MNKVRLALVGALVLGLTAAARADEDPAPQALPVHHGLVRRPLIPEDVAEEQRDEKPNGNRHFFLIRLASALLLASFFLKWGNLVAGFLGAPLPFSATAALLLGGGEAAAPGRETQAERHACRWPDPRYNLL